MTFSFYGGSNIRYGSGGMVNGGLYRSTHAAPDGNPHPQEGVTVVSVDDQSPTAAGDQALPPRSCRPPRVTPPGARPARAPSWRSAAWSAG
ncbi:hypothetical protein Aiant_42610 [Actinoplanes ianthinogenes]|uniref:Uncharacterized protein n=1 Tax=Actinoplanes ianthinogenes TaxID=122358 RepID=A0ABM7LW87_9ACTN|nr:hypothetical protein Aiant_42610 [Actinoplanes ianthinogenes]